MSNGTLRRLQPPGGGSDACSKHQGEHNTRFREEISRESGPRAEGCDKLFPLSAVLFRVALPGVEQFLEPKAQTVHHPPKTLRPEPKAGLFFQRRL